MGIKSVTIPEGITSIGEYAFYGCKTVTKLSVANTVESIGRYAFRNCAGLTNVEIPSSVTEIGASAFENCTAVTLRVAHGTYAHEYAEANGISFKLNEDIDGDGSMTNSDVALLVRVIAGWNTGCDTAYADITGDGKINNRDIIAIIQKLAWA